MKLLSFRRELLDRELKAAVPLMKGRVLDIGGQREKRRGAFRPPVDKVDSWEYLNIDESTKPDHCCSAESIPLEDGVCDTVLMVEVLEHLERPGRILAEAFRVLAPGGTLILSTPFLYPVHGAPYDFQRWTLDKLAREIQGTGFADVSIKHMGGVGAVVHDLFMVSLRRVSSGLFKKLGRIVLKLGRPLFRLFDSVFNESAHKVTGGHFVTARKPQ